MHWSKWHDALQGTRVFILVNSAQLNSLCRRLAR